MCDMDSKLCGEKATGYCSSSDDEEEGLHAEPATENNVNGCCPTAPQTGPKGVLRDYNVYKQLEQIEREENNLKAIEQHKKQAFTADPNKFPDKTEEEENDSFDDDDEFLKEYHEKRLAQMKEAMEKKMNEGKESFGKLFEFNAEKLLEALEEPNKDLILVVHIYDSIKPCIQMNKCLEQLAQEYPHIKFCKVLATHAGVSLNFKMNALPTLQVYKGGKLIGNFVRIHDQLGEEFYPGDVENYLIEKDVLFTSDKT